MYEILIILNSKDLARAGSDEEYNYDDSGDEDERSKKSAKSSISRNATRQHTSVFFNSVFTRIMVTNTSNFLCQL